MDTLAKLKERLDKLLLSYEGLQTQRDELEQDNRRLRERIAEMEQEIARLNVETTRSEKQLGEKQEIVAKRISRLVEKIDQLQSEMEFS